MPGSGLRKSHLRDFCRIIRERRRCRQLADEAARTTRNHYLWMALYAVLIFFLAVFAGLTYKHYRVTGELLPLQWLDIESPKAALKSMPLPQTENGMQH